MVQAAGKSAVSDSTFHMWRCIIALAQSDGQIQDTEIAYINDALAALERDKGLTAEQRQALGEDMVTPPADIVPLLQRVTSAADRAMIFHFGGLLAEADGELNPGEEEILQKLAVAGQLPAMQVQQYFKDTRAALERKKAAAELAALRKVFASSERPSALRLMVRYMLNKLGAK